MAIYIDHTHLGRHVTGLERITQELFSQEALAPLETVPVTSQGTAQMIATQTFGLPLKLAASSSILLCPGFPPSPLLLPFAKRVLAMPQAVLGIAFSFGIPMAFAAALGGLEWNLRAVPLSGWALLFANLFWVLAYDTEYAMVDRNDDLRIGVRSSAIALGRWDVPAIMIFYATYLILWAGLGLRLGLGRWFLVGIAVAAAQALWHFTLIRKRHRADCFKAFRTNHWLGFAVFAGTVADLALR